MKFKISECLNPTVAFKSLKKVNTLGYRDELCTQQDKYAVTRTHGRIIYARIFKVT